MTMHHHRPTTRGKYVTIGGKLYPVTGKIQQAAAAGALRQAGRASAAIEHWDGMSWSRTGETLHAAEAHATRRGGGGADMVPEVSYYAAGLWGRPGGGGGGARARHGGTRGRHPARRR